MQLVGLPRCDRVFGCPECMGDDGSPRPDTPAGSQTPLARVTLCADDVAERKRTSPRSCSLHHPLHKEHEDDRVACQTTLYAPQAHAVQREAVGQTRERGSGEPVDPAGRACRKRQAASKAERGALTFMVAPPSTTPLAARWDSRLPADGFPHGSPEAQPGRFTSLKTYS